MAGKSISISLMLAIDMLGNPSSIWILCRRMIGFFLGSCSLTCLQKGCPTTTSCRLRPSNGSFVVARKNLIEDLNLLPTKDEDSKHWSVLGDHPGILRASGVSVLNPKRDLLRSLSRTHACIDFSMYLGNNWACAGMAVSTLVQRGNPQYAKPGKTTTPCMWQEQLSLLVSLDSAWNHTCHGVYRRSPRHAWFCSPSTPVQRLPGVFAFGEV